MGVDFTGIDCAPVVLGHVLRRRCRGVTMGASGKVAQGMACSHYRLEWRHRWRGEDGVEREIVRVTEAEHPAALQTLALARADEAVGREFRITQFKSGREIGAVCLHAAELRTWQGPGLPIGVLNTRWDEEDRLQSIRWELYARISRAIAEASSLRIASRRGARTVLRAVRSLLIG